MALKIIQSVFLLLAMAGSACAEWTRVGGNELFRAYVDASSIVGIGNLVTISTLNDYSTLQTTTDGPAYMSSVVWLEFDCVWRWRRQLTATNFSGAMGSGTAVFSHDGSRFPIGPVERGSIGEKKWMVACGIYQGRYPEE